MSRIEWGKVKEINVLQSYGARARNSRKGITQMQAIIVAAIVIIAIVAGYYYYMSASKGATEGNKALARGMWDAVSRGDLNAASGFWSSNYKRYVSASAALNASAQKQRLAGLRAALNFTLTIDDMIAEGDRVAVKMTLRGTHVGTFQGIAPTGKTVTVSCFEIVRIENGKVVEHWGGPDTFDLLKQLGAVFSAGT